MVSGEVKVAAVWTIFGVDFMGDLMGVACTRAELFHFREKKGAHKNKTSRTAPFYFLRLLFKLKEDVANQSSASLCEF